MKYELYSVDSVQPPRIDWVGYSGDPAVTHATLHAVDPRYVIHYVLAGEGFFNGHRLKAGQGFLIAPGEGGDYKPSSEDPWTFLWIVTTDPNMRVFFERYGADEYGIFSFHNRHELDQFCERLNTASGQMATGAEMSEIFLHLFNSCSGASRPATPSMARVYFEFSQNYIESNLHLSVTVGELCHTLGVTQPYLYRIFKSALGISPKQYISERKISHAKHLLAKTELSVTQVASSVGFADVLEFSRFFSARAGVSPTGYRALAHPVDTVRK